MDVLDPLEKILDVAVALKELIEIFKTKDKWFESCYRYMDSIIETIELYKKARNLKVKVPTSCILLQEELDSFKDYLINEKKRSSISLFFRGSTMVKEAQEKMQGIEKQIHTFQLAISVEGQIETNQNFQKMQTISSTETDIKSKFVNIGAADMWVNYFPSETQVSWMIFSNGIKQYALVKDKIDLNETQMELILTTIDSDHDRLIRFDEWDKFYGIYWSKPDRKSFLDQKVLQKQSIKIPPLILKICQYNKEEPKKFVYPPDHILCEIAEEKVIFNDYEGKEQTILKNWTREALIFGKIKPNIFKPDIYFHNKLQSVNEKQFQIVIKKLISDSGFFLNNLSSGNPTALKIEKIPYVLASNMIFDVAETLIEIDDIIPESSDALGSDSPDYFLVNFEVKELTGDEPTIKIDPKRPRGGKKNQNLPGRNKKPLGPMPYIQFKILQGEDSKKDPIQFTITDRKTEMVIKIGSDEKNDIVIKECNNIMMKVKWDPIISQWVAYNDEENKGYGGAYLYLIASSEYKENNNKTGKLSIKLRNKMKVAFGYNELEVIMK